MITASILFIVGLTLSAFFSGSETGMYRVSRIRLVLDGLSGSLLGRGMIWLLNNPPIFIASILVGNNLANYLTSLAIVLGARSLFEDQAATELLATLLMTPVIFVGGELLPKFLFYQAPYRLLHLIRPILLVFTIIFLPLSVLLASLARALQVVTGATPFRVRLTMARQELEQVLREGQEAGILAGSQRIVAQNLFQIGNQPAVRFGVPIDRLAGTPMPADRDAAKSAARRRGHPIVLVHEGNRIKGFLLYADLLRHHQGPVEARSVVHANVSDKHLSVLLKLVDSGSDVALLNHRNGTTHSVVTRRQLLQPLLATSTN